MVQFGKVGVVMLGLLYVVGGLHGKRNLLRDNESYKTRALL